MKVTKKKHAGERGSEVVEFGLVCVPFFAFMLLILDISWAIFNKAVLQHAVEEGVRYAITYQTLTGLGQDASIKSVVQNNAIGMLQGSSGAALISIQYYDGTTLATTNSNAAGNVIQVSVAGYSLAPMGPLLHGNTPLTLSVAASDRTESCPNGVCPAR
jgi:Flp pilus assembly protein TadG